MEDRISVDLHEGVADVRLKRADKMNALTTRCSARSWRASSPKDQYSSSSSGKPWENRNEPSVESGEILTLAAA